MTAPKKKPVAKATSAKKETTKKKKEEVVKEKKVTVPKKEERLLGNGLKNMGKSSEKPVNLPKEEGKKELIVKKQIVPSSTKKVIGNKKVVKPVAKVKEEEVKKEEPKATIKKIQIGRNLNVVITNADGNINKYTKTATSEELQPIKDLIARYEATVSTAAANKIKDQIINLLTKTEQEKKAAIEKEKANIKVEKKVLKNVIKKTNVKVIDKKVNEVTEDLKSQSNKIDETVKEATEKKATEQPKANTGKSWGGERYR